jgi:hypothetical protein
MAVVWKISDINPSIKGLASGSISYETRSHIQYVFAGHSTFFKVQAAKCMNIRGAEKH